MSDQLDKWVSQTAEYWSNEISRSVYSGDDADVTQMWRDLDARLAGTTFAISERAVQAFQTRLGEAAGPFVGQKLTHKTKRDFEFAVSQCLSSFLSDVINGEI